MVKEFQVTLPFSTGDEPRSAFVYLPRGYGKNKSARYPVIYMFDGHNLFDDGRATFGKSWGLADFLDGQNIKVIIAAVECNHSGNGRLEEYSPVNFRYDDEKIKGRGDAYMQWLVNSFKPMIDENYRTLPDRGHTAVCGSSMGGLMSLYALARYGEYFSKGGALSPSLWACGGVPDFVKKSSFKGVTLYTDYGSKEFSNHKNMRAIFAATVSALIERGAAVTARVVRGGTHCEECWQKALPYLFAALFPRG